MKKKFLLMLTFMLALGMLFGCNNSDTDDGDKQSDSGNDKQMEEKMTDVSLSDWDGEWNSIVYWYDEPEVMKGLGDKPQEAIDAKNKGAHTDFASLKVEDDSITFLDKEGNEVSKSKYKFVKKEVKGEGEHSEWDIFEAVDEADDMFKTVALMPIHGEEGDLTHFHARYGKTVEEALSDDTWWPVIASPKTTVEQVVDEIKTLD